MSESFQDLSEQQVRQVAAGIAKAGARSDCPMCGKQLVIQPYLHALLVGHHTLKAGATGSGKATMCAVQICNGCGFVANYSLVTLGLDSML